MNHHKAQSRTAEIITILAGIWLLISAGMFSPIASSMYRNFIFLGIAIIVVSLIRAFTPISTGPLSWANILFGIWLIISPFIIGYINPSVMWNSIIVGVIVGGLSLWSGAASRVGMAHAKGRDDEEDRWRKYGQ